MLHLPIYLDNQATTRVDPRVAEAMWPYFTEIYGNAGSTTHGFGAAAKDAVDEARAKIAAGVGAKAKEIVWTSGATESNNLAIRGVAEKHAGYPPAGGGRHIISAATEHPAVLDPLAKLAQRGFEITLLPVIAAPDPRAGVIRVEQLAAAIRDDTILVSIMLANNEIGVLQPLAEIGQLCKQRGVLLHSDATQAVGKVPVDVEALGVDLMSFTAHKIYGPKGIGALYVRRAPGGPTSTLGEAGRGPRVRLESQIDGGGQEGGLRSGTANVPGIVGFARALELCLAELPAEAERLSGLRDGLFAGLSGGLSNVTLNGPALDLPGLRLPGNLNVGFGNVAGEALLIQMRDIALSTGSACTSAQPEPSHVLRSLGLSEDAVRGSLRFGLGRFTTAEEIDFVIARAVEGVRHLRAMSSIGS